MAVIWNKTYRGGVQRTTPETREVAEPDIGSVNAGSVKAGMVASLSDAGDLTIAAAAEGVWYYFVGERLFGSMEEEQTAVNEKGTRDTVRMYSPRYGDLYTGRADDGVALRDDLPLTVNASGLLVAGAPGIDVIVAYVDMPASAFPKKPTRTITTAGQLIPVKIK